MATAMRSVVTGALRLTPLVLLSVCVGCGGGAKYDGPTRAAVSGEVTLNGEPLSNGTVTFIPTAPEEQRQVTAYMAEGHYELPEGQGPNLGAYQVSVSWKKEEEGAEEMPVMDGEEQTEEVTVSAEEQLPPKYNSETELKVEVKAGGNTFNFDLES